MPSDRPPKETELTAGYARALELDAEVVVVGLSGGGDKDLETVLER